VYTGDHPVGGRFGVHLEGQWRRHDVLVRPQQAMFRPALNFRVSPRVAVSSGYGFVSTHRYGESPVLDPFPEHRAYQQVEARHQAGAAQIQHRLRFEERWLKLRLPASAEPEWHYQNRVRYMLRGSVPVGRDGWYGALWNEILLNVPPTKGASGYDQNRAFAGVGRKLDDDTRVEVGYMQQTLLQRSGRVMEFNHTVYFGIFSTLRLR
jgi:hypothetical protein